MTRGKWPPGILEALAGNQWTITPRADLGQGGTLNVRIQVPVGNQLIALGLRISRENAVEVALHDEVSDVSGGTAIDPRNNLLGTNLSNPLTVEQDVTYTAVETHQSFDLFGAGTNQYLQEADLIVTKNSDVVIELSNIGSGNNEVSMRLTWILEDV